MAACSAGFGLVLGRARAARRVAAITPALGTLALAFGVWYVLGALESVPYPL